MSDTKKENPPRSGWDDFRVEFSAKWRKIPRKGPFFVLLLVWVGLFHFLGNSTLGYIDSSSLFGWLDYAYKNSLDDEHGYLIPFVVLALLWWKRDTLASLDTRPWWPGLVLLVGAILLHVAGFLIQQTRVSVVGFFGGIYALMGIVWGPRLLKATFFPFFLFAFCVPLASPLEPFTFQLRLLATKITSLFSQGILGISVICDGTRIFDPNGTYRYEVAAACSGIRSLTATFAIALVYSFVAFRTFWRRGLLIFAAFPLAVLANVVRLSMIIMAAEAFGQDAGNYVHSNSFFSLLPYIPAVGGVLLLGHWLREKSHNENKETDSSGPALMTQQAKV